MKKIVVVCAGFALALAAGMAHATKPGNNGGGNGGCGVGQTTNGCGGGSTANTAHGGAGGNGVGVGVGIGIGQGGNANATGGQGGAGGSVIGSGNSSNLNNNANSNKQGQAQGQKQGQQQGQAQSSRNDNRSNASNSNSNANSGNNSDQSVTVQGDSYEASRIPVATAYAPNIAPTAVCMGSTSAGGQGMTFGVSFGTSWTDDNCMLLEQVRTVAVVIGDKAIAAEMMCDVPAYASARERAGHPCGQKQIVAAASVPAVGTAYVVETKKPAPRSSRYEGNDPIVRARLGLPPLKQ